MSPEIIAVHTTCLSETIGDDIPQIIAKARKEGKIPKANTSFTPIPPATWAPTSPVLPI